MTIEPIVRQATRSSWQVALFDVRTASQAAIAGWDDQEIANLIIARRREQGQDVEKALRLRVGNSIGIDFKIVSELEKNRSGKTPFIISKIGLSLWAI